MNLCKTRGGRLLTGRPILVGPPGARAVCFALTRGDHLPHAAYLKSVYSATFPVSKNNMKPFSQSAYYSLPSYFAVYFTSHCIAHAWGSCYPPLPILTVLSELHSPQTSLVGACAAAVAGHGSLASLRLRTISVFLYFWGAGLVAP